MLRIFSYAYMTFIHTFLCSNLLSILNIGLFFIEFWEFFTYFGYKVLCQIYNFQIPFQVYGLPFLFFNKVFQGVILNFYKVVYLNINYEITYILAILSLLLHEHGVSLHWFRYLIFLSNIWSFIFTPILSDMS